MMIDPAAFLLAKAQEMRDLADESPDLANALRRMAEECERQADELRQDRRRDARA
jgi:HAMP domain-containing protein